MKFKNDRDAAAWMIYQGRALLASNLPSREIVARYCTLSEAQMWMRAYNNVMEGHLWTAVIVEDRERITHALEPVEGMECTRKKSSPSRNQ